MGKKGIGLILALGLFLGCMVPARAETYYGDDSWHVAFTPEEEMESTFKTADLDEVVSGLQPGDNVIITLALENRHKETTDWYMTNKVLYSLEDRSANSATGGGAYTYRLAYTDKAGTETVLFDSETVGGEETSAAGEVRGGGGSGAKALGRADLQRDPLEAAGAFLVVRPWVAGRAAP